MTPEVDVLVNERLLLVFLQTQQPQPRCTLLGQEKLITMLKYIHTEHVQPIEHALIAE